VPRKKQRLRELLQGPGAISEPISTIAAFVKDVDDTSKKWQDVDIKKRELDDESFLNDARIVGQTWFRGQGSSRLSLRPGLYREDTWEHLKKATPSADDGDQLFEALLEIEHELRIDFTSYGHLLNESNQAKSPIDWYFLMQHYRLPTRLLDWTTNALAALFFAVDGHSPYFRERKAHDSADNSISLQVAVWMVDAYWLADSLSDEWGAPILAYSADASKYVPPLDQVIERGDDTEALIPRHSMPIEPPAMHPRVAAQEGRFIIFGRTQDLLEEKVLLGKDDDCKVEECRLRQIRFEVKDVNAVLGELAQLGVSRRTLFPDLGGLAEFVHWKHFHKVSQATASAD